MPVDPINGHRWAGMGAPVKPKDQLSMEVFLRLLTVQLANQNPLEPMNDRDFFAQMAQLGQVEGMQGMQDSMDEARINGLIGKGVVAVRPFTDGAPGGQDQLVTGIVEKLVIRDGQRLLAVREPDGKLTEVKLQNIREVVHVPEPPKPDFGADALAVALIGSKVRAEIQVPDGNGGQTTVGVTGTVKRLSLRNGERVLIVVDETDPKKPPYEVRLHQIRDVFR